MGDKDEGGLALLVQFDQDFEDPGAVARVEVAGRFVGKDDLGLVDEGAADGDTLFLAA